MQLFRYEAVIAKCRCLYGKLLTAKNYETLLKFTSISDIATYMLNNTAYSEFFGDATNIKEINRSKLEYYIKKSLINDFVKIYRFTYGEEHHFVNLLLAKYELEFILKTWKHLAWLNAKNSFGNDDEEYLLDIGALEIQMISMIYQYTSKIDIEALKNASNIEQFMAAISKTDYFNIFLNYMTEDVFQNYTKLETAIYNEYYKMLYDSAKVFDRDTQKNVQWLIGMEMDLINIDRISRLFLNFSGRLSSADKIREIVPLLIPIRFKLKEENINQLISFDNKDDFLEYCDTHLYYGRKKSFRDYDTIEQYKWAFLNSIYRSSTSHTSSGFEVIIKYFLLKQIEIKNLFCLTEGIRYKMNPIQIKKYLIGLETDYFVQDERGFV